MQGDEKKVDMGMQSGQQELGTDTQLLSAVHSDEFGGCLTLPITPTSTYVFPDAETGKLAFALAYGLEDEAKKLIEAGYSADGQDIYSRLSFSTMRAIEQMMLAHEPGLCSENGWSYAFPSGMSAINNLIRACCRPAGPRNVVLHSGMVYGGTHALMECILPNDGIKTVHVDMRDLNNLQAALELYGDRVGLVFTETPSNPTLEMFDVREIKDLMLDFYGEDAYPPLAVDNTFMGVFQHPIEHGADIVAYSMTKYIGGHSNALGGLLVGLNSVNVPFTGLDGTDVPAWPIVRALGARRTITGPTIGPQVAYYFATQVQTYPFRMRVQAERATKVAAFLNGHDKVREVRYPTLFEGRDREIYEKQCHGPSGIVCFTLADDTEAAAYRLLNTLSAQKPKIVALAVSLGCVHTLIDHAASWTHSDVSPEVQRDLGITPGQLRLSVGLENANDVINALNDGLVSV